MAASRASDAALQDLLERLQAASSELDGSGEPDAVAEEAAALALRLTGSTQVDLTVGDQIFTRSTDSRGLDENIATAELVAGGQVLGAIKVVRATPYSDYERRAFAIFASLAASVIDSAHRRRSSERGERAHELAVESLRHAQEDLNRSLDRLVKVDAARQLLLKNLTTVVERERTRIVSELHDDALQKLTAAELQVARLAPGGKVDPEGLASLRALMEETEAALRRLVFDVRPPALEGPDGLAQSIRDRLSMLSANGVSHDLKIDLPSDLSPDDRAMIFREVAESIANVERHANASHVKVWLTLSGGGVTGVVQDDGQGFDVAQRSNLPGHLGLLALRERALMAGGRYKIESKPGAGTRIEFWIPVQT